MDKTLKTLNEAYPLEEQQVGEFAKIKVKGMNFTIQKYYAKELGNISVMRAVGFFSLMKMDIFINKNRGRCLFRRGGNVFKSISCSSEIMNWNKKGYRVLR